MGELHAIRPETLTADRASGVTAPYPIQSASDGGIRTYSTTDPWRETD